MKNLFIVILCGVFAMSLYTSCESCVRRAAKKATEVAMSAAEGVVEAVNERGEEFAKNTTDALGLIAKGTLTSIDEQLNEHAETVAQSVGRTFVQSLEGFDKGLTNEYWTQVEYKEDFPGGVTLDYIGKIDSKSVVDAFFIITDGGNYAMTFDYTDADGKVLFSNSTEAYVSADEVRKFTVVSYALNSTELAAFEKVAYVSIQVKKK